MKIKMEFIPKNKIVYMRKYGPYGKSNGDLMNRFSKANN